MAGPCVSQEVCHSATTVSVRIAVLLSSHLGMAIFVILYKKQSGTQREKKHVLTLTLMLVRRKSACKTSAGSKIPRWLTPLFAENLNPSWFKNPFYVNPRTYT